MSDDLLKFNLLLVGASASNLALAHRLVDLASESKVQFNFCVLDKAREIGHHTISGAIVNPRTLKLLFPDFMERGDFPLEGICTESHFSVLGLKEKWDMPRWMAPPEMQKEGYAVLTMSNVVKWMAEELEKKVAGFENVEMEIFPGFAAQAILYDESDKVIGVKVADEGDPATDNIYADIVSFGDKGFLSRDLVHKFHLRKNPQQYSVGVKEVWEIRKSMLGKVWHTLGWPVLDGSFGGGFVYGMKDNRLSIGLIISLDSPNPNIRPQPLLQDFKKHPWLQKILAGGKLIKYGAAVLPEGGYYSLPDSFAVNGALLVGDALGVLDVKRLDGVNKSLASGWFAAKSVHEALLNKDYSNETLGSFQDDFMNSWAGDELKDGRYFRNYFSNHRNLLGKHLRSFINNVVDVKGENIGLMDLGVFGAGMALRSPIAPFEALGAKFASLGIGHSELNYDKDHKHIKPNFKKPEMGEPAGFDKDSIFSTVNAVFTAQTEYHEGNQHIDEHDAKICMDCISQYDELGKDTPCVADCTAEVHRIDERQENGAALRVHGMSLENCVQCRTCEIVCPAENLRVNAALEGSGPNFMGL